MKFSELIDRAIEFLRRRERVSYRALKREFDLDDESLEDLKAELIDAQRLAADEDGKVFVWIGNKEAATASPHLPSPQPPTPPAESHPPEAERRQLTVMFCDLVGSTALSEQLDPEELRDVVRAYHETCASAISRYGGHTAQHLGDGLLVYFGYPTAHEDDAQRAVRTGFEILLGLQQLNDRLPPTIKARLPHPLQVRIGIHTGLVVVGEIGSGEKHETLALGETPNIAARIQGQAESDTMLISAATHHLIEGLFECEDYGQPALKGIALPLRLYRVLKAEAAQSRFQVVVRKGLTPLVGREREYALLHERWQQVKDGAGQVVLLSGEPGIGKSRLVEALKQTVEQEGARCLELRCSPYAQNSALAPVIEHVQRQLQFSSTDASKMNLEKLHQALSRYRLPQADALALLAALLSLPPPDDVPPLTLSPQKQKEKTQEVLVTWLCEEARQQAVTYAWEDLHWADPSTLELLALFLQQVPTARLLALLTYRPEFIPPWSSHSYVSQLTLSRLVQSHVEVMVDKVTAGKTLPREIVRQIASKTDGVPLFVEELTKMVMESGLVTEVNGRYELTGPLPPLAIPSTLHDSLMARLDRLATVREIAQIGATLGREFTYDLLQAVAPLSEEALQRGLRQLVEAELVFQSGVPPHARYLFKHALVQDTAYQSLLKSRRQQLHQQVAQVLVERFRDAVETQPELVAHHYTEAGLKEQALPYWQRAGERAVQRSANAEAIHHLTKGLKLLETLPDTPERNRQELTLDTALGPALIATKGNAAPEVEQTYTRARELCQQLGEPPQLFPVLFGLRSFHLVRGEVQTAHELGEQLLGLAQGAHDTDLLIEARLAVGNTSLIRGDFTRARAQFEQAVALYDPRQHRSHAFLYGLDPGVFCLGRLGWSLGLLGYPAQALEKLAAALTLAQEVSHPFSLVITRLNAAPIHQLRRDGRALQELREAAIELCTEHGFANFLGQLTAHCGWALAEQGQLDEGIAQILQGLDACRATGARLFISMFLALLADACRKAEQREMGLNAVAEALELVQQNGEHINEAELYRLKGELTLQQQSKVRGSKVDIHRSQPLTANPQGEAEACFLKAIEIARRQQAKWLELRAVMSLSRLWQQQGKKAEARQMLTEIYGWFTEGFDTKDLQEARVLLEELNH